MKTIIVKPIMMVIVVIALVHYALYLKTGEIPWKRWQVPDISLPAVFSKSVPQAKNLLPGTKTRVYTWVDENGVTHYSQEPPPADVAVRELEVDSANINVMQSVAITSADEPPTASPVGNFGAGENTPLQKAQEAAALLEARDANQKKILDSL